MLLVWQKYLDTKESQKNSVDEGMGKVKTELITSEEVKSRPWIYALLPLLPLAFLLGCGEYGIKGLKMTVITAMFLSLTVSMLVEWIRTKNVKDTFASIQVFFKGMGDQFAMTVTLIVAGESFAYGLQKLGVVTQVIDASQSLGLSVGIITIIIAAIIIFFSLVMGSGVAPMFAFTPLMPNIANGIGGNLPAMLLSIQNSASLGRLLSPITAVVVAVSGIANLSPVDLVKRNSVPVMVAICVSLLSSLLLN